MAIALRGTPTSAQIPSSGTLTINVPAGVQNGDVMVAIVTSASVGVPSTPAGWNVIDSAAASPFAQTYYRVASSEPASYGFTISGSAGFGVIAAYSGVSNGSPINAHSAFHRVGSGTTYNCDTITTTVNGAMLLAVASVQSSETSISPPTGYTSEASSVLNPTTILADKAQVSAGATGAITGTYSATSAAQVGSQIALAPAAPPVNTVAPSVTGSTTVGSTLTTDNGTWSNSPTSFSYQWKSNGVNVGSNQNTYVTQAGDVGNAVGCTVTATNADGSASQASNTITVTGASLSTVIAKTGTSGSAVMQKAKASWTYITQKTGTSGTAVDQKGAGSYTKIKGH